MKVEIAVEHTRRDVIQLCHSALDSRTLRIELLKRLRTVIPFDYIFFSTTDPATQLFTSSVIDDTPTWALAQFLENEFVQDDFNKFRFLLHQQLPVGVLSEHTQQQFQRSQRYRDILEPLALGDEMRAVFVTNAACWGTLCLHRERGAPTYTPAEASFLAQLTPHIAEGLRKALLAQHVPAATTPDGPGVLVLAEDFSVVTMSPVAAFWLAELAAERGNPQALPHAVMAVVKRLQALEGETTTGYSTPKLRVHTPSGHWLMLYASRLNSPEGQGHIAVMFETARPAEIAPLIMQAYQLTKREGEVTGLILRGLSTVEIAATLHISSNTVQDHLKAIFEKVSVRSRRELTATIFAQQYQRHFIAGAPLNAAGQFISSEQPSSEHNPLGLSNTK
jgi:DNA-binding CsgD family transcriptional regulator/GAF domain-containing protein